ncbi:hypothetical protein M5K25_021248 [Dendrobium thyrsiflorum]|uniref:Cyclin-like domain-containing protein n=1 Tax=Dendrobium thyrsiflorum TaxID=117978 RepID=A0ABD0UC48_DENTH
MPLANAEHVVYLSVAILVVLFLFQRFGTNKVSFSFSPIMVLWFSFTAMIGLYNIIKFYPSILKALSPHYIFYFFQRNHRKGWELLGAIALCITGKCIFLNFHVSLLDFDGGAEIGNAFGVTVIWVMLITTVLMPVVMLVIWDTNIILVVTFLAVYLSIEGVYMSSLLSKLAHGGWVPFAISAFFLVITLSWTYGRRKKSQYEDGNKMRKQELNQLVEVHDIDSCDVDIDQFGLAEYVEDLYKFYRTTEKSSQINDYMNFQVEIDAEMRAKVAYWLIQVHEEYQLMPETLYLTLQIMDRYLSIQTVKRRTLQFVGINSMLIACKYVEKRGSPKVHELVSIFRMTYNKSYILKMEKSILDKLDWSLTGQA